MVSGFDKRGTNYENVWEHGNIGQYWKGTKEQGPPPWETLIKSELNKFTPVSPARF